VVTNLFLAPIKFLNVLATVLDATVDVVLFVQQLPAVKRFVVLNLITYMYTYPVCMEISSARMRDILVLVSSLAIVTETSFGGSGLYWPKKKN